jgi:four helix bundle protein
MKESGIKNYRGLLVYQKAHILVIAIYRSTKKYPKEELFGLVSQMRRCAVSITANIVEGYGRKT